MTSRSSSSSSVSSKQTASSRGVKDSSSVTNTAHPTSMAETSTQRSISPASSHKSERSSHKSERSSHKSERTSAVPYDAASLATTTNTGFTNNTSVTGNTALSQQRAGSSTPVSRTPVIQPKPQQQQSGITNVSVNKPIQPTIGLTHPQHQQNKTQPTQPTVGLTHPQHQQNKTQPTQPTVGLTHPQYRPNVVQPGINPQGGSTKILGGGPFLNTANTNLGNVINHQGPHNGQYYFQQNLQARVGNQIYGQQGFNPIFGPDAFDDVILNVDYGAMDSYNIGIQSHGFTSGQIQGGFGAGGPVLGGIGAPVVGDFGGSGLGGFDVGGSVLGGFGEPVLGGIGGSVLGGFGEPVLGGIGGSVLGGFGEPVLGGIGGSVLGGFGEPVLGGIGGSVLGGFGEPVLGGIGGSVLGGFNEPVFGGIGEPVLGGIGEPGLGGINVGGSVMGGFGAGGPQFDAAKAVFNLADTNKDGVLSRNEFQQWAQGGIQNVGGQLHSIHPTKAGVTTTAINNPNNLNLPQVPQGFNPQIANILEQSGLSKFV
ncbi:unnamed protein product [Rotaria sp. Silwood1]|nr:unnamed protein product [Rotaria sp. Silwood1]CAF4745823.1 unnamed protein product [Rotaria sp. Silwood1]